MQIQIAVLKNKAADGREEFRTALVGDDMPNVETDLLLAQRWMKLNFGGSPVFESEYALQDAIANLFGLVCYSTFSTTHEFPKESLDVLEIRLILSA